MLCKVLSNRKKSIGLSPGTLIHIGEKKAGAVKMSMIEYDSTNLRISEIPTGQLPAKIKSNYEVFRLNINGLHEIPLLENIMEQFSVNALVMEDLLNTLHQPKIEMYDDFIFATDNGENRKFDF